MNNNENNTNNGINQSNNPNQPVISPISENQVPINTNMPNQSTVSQPQQPEKKQETTEPTITPIAPPVMAPIQNNQALQPILVSTEQNQATTPQIVIAPPSDKPIDASGPSVTMVNKPAMYQQTIKENEPPKPQINNQQTEPPKPEETKESEVPSKKKGSILTKVLIFLIIGLIGYIGYSTFSHKATIARMEKECTPVSTTNGEKKLDLNSTIVKDLYGKVKTYIREDLANNEFNDNYKLYLAFMQIPRNKFYESNCEMFSQTNMEPFKCKESASFSPLAFKAGDLKLELKKLFGERSEIPLANIQLGTSCYGGFQYIKERDEFVQGECSKKSGISYKADKKLISATSNKSTITLKEQVKYYSGEGMELPETLKSGVYVYTFKLDSNYNYALINKTYEGI